MNPVLATTRAITQAIQTASQLADQRAACYAALREIPAYRELESLSRTLATLTPEPPPPDSDSNPAPAPALLAPALTPVEPEVFSAISEAASAARARLASSPQLQPLLDQIAAINHDIPAVFDTMQHAATVAFNATPHSASFESAETTHEIRELRTFLRACFHDHNALPDLAPPA